jgi:co-chaperonin GroES (HSP10)
MFRPCGHRLVIHRDPVEETYGEMGLIVHAKKDSAKLEAANCQTGVILALGPDCWKAFRKIDEKGTEVEGQPWAKVGDYVLYSKYAGRNINDPFTPDEEDIIIINDEDVIAVIEPEKTKIPVSDIRINAKGAK